MVQQMEKDYGETVLNGDKDHVKALSEKIAAMEAQLAAQRAQENSTASSARNKAADGSENETDEDVSTPLGRSNR